MSSPPNILIYASRNCTKCVPYFNRILEKHPNAKFIFLEDNPVAFVHEMLELRKNELIAWDAKLPIVIFGDDVYPGLGSSYI